jgi:hypothetical protein
VSAKEPAVATQEAEVLSYYASQSSFTDPGEMSALLAELPRDIATLQRIANGLVIHFRIEDPLAVGISEERFAEIDGRYAETMLARLLELDDRTLAERRAPQHRLLGCCRDFTVIFLAMARAFGLPARARVGFATYFFSGVRSDHEVAEVWDAAQRRWRLVDAQLRDTHIDPNDGVRIDPADVPRERFLVAGTAWRLCRAGEADPATFMVRPDIDMEMTHGWPYICHNLGLDLAALNKMEMLLWDIWGLAGKGLFWKSVTPEEIELLDRVAQVTDPLEPELPALKSLYMDEPLLRVPDTFTSFNPVTLAPSEITLR